MHGNVPDHDSTASGSGTGSRFRRGAGFGQPATDSELLRQFARTYEEHQTRGTGPLVMPDVTSERRSPFWASGVLGLVVFVVLLAVTMGLAVILMGPR